MVPTSLAKPSASSKRRRRRISANTAQDDWFWGHGIDCMEGRPDCLNEEKNSIINFDHKIEI
jgi:hypothetical protein